MTDEERQKLCVRLRMLGTGVYDAADEIERLAADVEHWKMIANRANIDPKPLAKSDAEPVIEAAEFTDQMFSLAFDITPIESCEIMELGEKLGLLEQVAYDPKIHGGEIDADDGDLIYVRSAKGEALRARAADGSGK